MRQESIFPGQPWLDTNGNAIQAHGGAVYYEDGVYYWYGENKEHTDGASDVWTWGIKVYSSRDLCNWQDEGYLVEPDVDDPASPLHPSKRVDRPHILRCPQTGRYVLWLKLSGKDACFVILSSERLLGPYQMEIPVCGRRAARRVISIWCRILHPGRHISMSASITAMWWAMR